MLSFSTHGAGDRDVILLHGFLGSGRNLGSLARRWSERAPAIRSILPDLPGHGGSPPLPPGADLGTLAKAVLDLAEQLEVQAPYRFVGHSLGGRVALRARLLDPSRVEEIILLDITPGPVDARASGVQDVLRAMLAAPAELPRREDFIEGLIDGGLSKGLAEWLSMNVAKDGDHYRWRIDRQALSNMNAVVSSEDLWPAVEKPGCRIGLVRAANSAVVSDADTHRLAHSHRPVFDVEGAGHFLHQDQPERVLEAILSLSVYLAGRDVGGARTPNS